MRFAAALLFGLAVPAMAYQYEARSAHFRVVTSAAPETASLAAARLEQSYAQLAALGFRTATPRMEVILFPDRAAMTPYAPASVPIGFFQEGSDASFLAVSWKDAADPLRTASHELVHRMLLFETLGKPAWVREGLAELLSHLEPVPGGLRLGLPIPRLVDLLQTGQWLEWTRVVSGQAKATDMFYAQSWLLAHSLLVGGSGTIAERVAALREPERFPSRMPEALASEVTPAPVRVAAEPIAVRPLEAWEWEHRMAELLRALNRPAQAREILVSLRIRYPGRPEPAESLGAIEMDAFRYDAAEGWFAEASRFESENPRTHYRYSLLLMRPGRPAREALRHARRAVELDPAQALYWLARAQAEMALSQWNPALTSLAQVRERASDPTVTKQVGIELAELDRRREQALRPPPTPAPLAAPVTIRMELPPVPPPPVAAEARSVPPQPPQAGTVQFWGFIRNVECTGSGKIVTVTSPRFTVRVVERPGRPARLHSPPGNLRQIPCSLKNVEVNVVYRPAAHFGPLNGDLIAVLF